MSKPIVIIPTQADADPDDVAALRDAGVLVLRCSLPSEVKVLSTESVVADGVVFRALLDTFAAMPKNYGTDEARAMFARNTVKYAQQLLAPQRGNDA